MDGNSLLLSDSPCTRYQRRYHLSLATFRETAKRTWYPLWQMFACYGRFQESDSLLSSLKKDDCVSHWIVCGYCYDKPARTGVPHLVFHIWHIYSLIYGAESEIIEFPAWDRIVNIII